MINSLLPSLLESLELNRAQLARLIARAPHAYKVYSIPKKSGGTRTVAQPAQETKYVQYWLIENIFSKLPVHECATAYKAGASIKENAAKHKSNSYLSKFDFKDFFPSIKEKDLISHFAEYLPSSFSNDDLKILARLSCISDIVTHELHLSIGAPSSPILSNSIMFAFDKAMDEWCQPRGFVYTRYADDLTFSTNEKNRSADLEPAICNTISKLDYPTLKLNTKKTIHVSKKHQRRVTGVIVNNEGDLSIGRSRKRMISSLIHKFSLGQLSEEEKFQLQGLLSFSKDIEPDFIKRMSIKYGNELIREIFFIRK